MEANRIEAYLSWIAHHRARVDARFLYAFRSFHSEIKCGI